MNRHSKKYYKAIKAIIPSKGKQERRLIKDYKTRIIELNELQPDITYSELQEKLGTPVDIVTEYYDGADVEYIMKQIRTAKIIRFCIYCILTLALASAAVSVGVNIKLYQEIHGHSITHEKIIIE